MSGNELDIQEIIEAAVLAAHEVGVKGMDEKIQAAINVALPLGIKIGAEVGSKIGAEMGAAAAIEAMEREQEKYRRQGGGKLYGWQVGAVEVFREKKPLAEYGLDRPPQSWQYLRSGRSDKNKD